MCPDPHLGSWNCLPHQAHIALSEPMSSIDQQGSSLGSLPTSPPFIPTLISLRAFDLVSSRVWWEAATNIWHVLCGAHTRKGSDVIRGCIRLTATSSGRFNPFFFFHKSPCYKAESTSCGRLTLLFSFFFFFFASICTEGSARPFGRAALKARVSL